MRGTRLSKLYVAGALLAPMVLVAGVARAQCGPIGFLVIPVGVGEYTDAEIPEVTGSVSTGRLGYSAFVSVSCETSFATSDRACESPFDDPDRGSSVVVATDHPDRIEVRDKRFGVSHKQKSNPARVQVTTGSGSEIVRNVLSCEKARVSFEERSGRAPVRRRFEALARDCVCVRDESDDCGALDRQATLFATHCEQSPEALELLEFGPGGMVRLRVRSLESTAPPSVGGVGVRWFRDRAPR